MKNFILSCAAIGLFAVITCLASQSTEATGGIFGRRNAYNCSGGQCSVAPVATVAPSTQWEAPPAIIVQVDNNPMGSVPEPYDNDTFKEQPTSYNGPVLKALATPPRLVAAPVRAVAQRKPVRSFAGRILQRRPLRSALGRVFCRR